MTQPEEELTQAAAWVSLEDVMLREVSQRVVRGAGGAASSRGCSGHAKVTFVEVFGLLGVEE